MIAIGVKMTGPYVRENSKNPLVLAIMSSVTCGFFRIASAARSNSASITGWSAPRLANEMIAMAIVTISSGTSQLPRSRLRKTAAGEKKMSTKSSQREALGVETATLGSVTRRGVGAKCERLTRAQIVSSRGGAPPRARRNEEARSRSRRPGFLSGDLASALEDDQVLRR